MKRFATPRQVILLTLLWAALLFGVDLALRPRAVGDTFKAGESAAGATTPRLSLWINHLCCSGCLDDLAGALAKFAWIPRNGIHVLQALPDMGTIGHGDGEEAALPAATFGNRVDVTVTDMRLVDFVALDRAIRDAGLVAGHIEVSGIPHVRFSAEITHVCCRLCAVASRRGLDVLQTLRGGGAFPWLDSLTFEKEHKTVTAHARYGATVDVTELMDGLDRIGFAPVSLSAIVDPER